MVDNTIALQAKPPSLQDSLAPISTMLNMRSQALDVQQKQQQWDARQATAKVINDSQYHDENGQLDLTKAMPALIKADPGNYYATDLVKNIASARSSDIAARGAQQQLGAQTFETLAQAAGSAKDSALRDPLNKDPNNPKGRDPLHSFTENILDLQRTGALPPQVTANLIDKMPKGMSYNDKLSRLTQLQLAALKNSELAGKQFAPVQYMDTGQQAVPVQTEPLAQPGGIGPVPGAAGLQKQIPPTAQITDKSGEPHFFGAQGGQGGRSGAPGMGPQTGLSPGDLGTIDTVNKHYAEVIGEAGKAAQDVGVLQNIKKYAAGAVTGVASDRRAYISGLAGLVGIDSSQDAKTKTDLLQKESTYLALTGGDTNLAKTLAESANPNSHMTKEAIMKAADRVASMRELAIDKNIFFQQFKGDPKVYNEKIAEWNKFADPRAIQWPHMTESDKRETIKSMSVKERDNFKQKLRWFQENGFIK